MKVVADLHLHSKYSRAVSREMNLENMASWATKKGISILATGDWTHPLWFSELENKLEDDESGLLRLRTNDKRLTQNTTSKALDVSQSALSEQKVYFLLSCEISSIYSQDGQVRRIHNLVFVPSLKSAQNFNQQLLKQGANLRADGRPIIGLSSRDLAELVLSVDDKALIIPAHIWTPWFSLYGSNSGFDSIKECFGDMSDYIYGIETGLSSDPAMNWRIKELDGRTILSFSDAHSLPKMGREATIFEIPNSNLSYDLLRKAIMDADSNCKVAATLEFFPEEGKYHYTGHRSCNLSYSPNQTKEHGSNCPVCGKSLTIGVMQRVEDLSARSEQELEILKDDEGFVKSKKMSSRPAYKMLVPLIEILAESLNSGETTKTVHEEYQKLVDYFDSELAVLLKATAGDLNKVVNEKVAEGILKVRSGNIIVEPGYDGVFGTVRIWHEQEGKIEDDLESQLSLL